MTATSVPLAAPFRALRPAAEHAAGIAAPPYDVVSTAEAAEIAGQRPRSFLHVSRAEVDLPPGTDPHEAIVYAQAADTFSRWQRSGILVRDPEPSFYVYRLTMGKHQQMGVAFAASVAAYETERIRRHELTRPDKERDRVRHIATLNAQTGPVLLAYAATAGVDTLLEQAAAAPPLFDIDGPNDVRHTVWRVAPGKLATKLGAALNALPRLYIADGHHRSAAAARVAAERRTAATADSSASHERFLTVAFPHDQLRIFDYNRVVRDLGDHDASSLIAALRERFEVGPSLERVRPRRPAEFGMYLAGVWHRLRLGKELIPSGDPVASLDVSLLQEHVLAPLLGIGDPRTDARIDFVGGVRGLAELERRVDRGEAAVAFALHPTQMEQLMAVADARRLMPPKSTWFEPKLADGLLSHVLD